MNKLRQEAVELVSAAQTTRPAVLRRSLRPDMLYATDLPQVTDGETVADFLQKAERAGWQTEAENGWILMDRIPEQPPENGFRGPCGPEARCCASLLTRHSGRNRPDGKRERRMLLKAGEEGTEAYEKACGQLHREWAAALRKREPLPDVAIQFFTGGKEA